MGEGRPDIFTYHDAVEFLRDQLRYLKKQGKTTLELAQKSGVSKSYISLVLARKRVLTEKTARKLAPHLEISKEAQKSFLHLCELGNSSTINDRRQVLEKMQKQRGYRRRNPSESEVFTYLSHWYFVAIREMAALGDFQADPEWICRRLRNSPPPSENARALEFLINHGFLERSDSSIRPPQKRLECVDVVYKTALIEYYRQLYNLAVDHVEHIPQEHKIMVGNTIALSAGTFTKVKTLLEDTFKKIAEMADNDTNTDNVYHINLLGFPLTLTRQENQE